MSRCTAFEPAPTRFYAPRGLFTNDELSRMGAEWLGEWVQRPRYEFAEGELEAMGLSHLVPFIQKSPPLKVATGPLCRLYWGKGKPEPHSFESAYVQNEKGQWQRCHANYLSYQLANCDFITVRWESPVRDVIVCTKPPVHPRHCPW